MSHLTKTHPALNQSVENWGLNHGMSCHPKRIRLMVISDYKKKIGASLGG